MSSKFLTAPTRPVTVNGGARMPGEASQEGLYHNMVTFYNEVCGTSLDLDMAGARQPVAALLCCYHGSQLLELQRGMTWTFASPAAQIVRA